MACSWNLDGQPVIRAPPDIDSVMKMSNSIWTLALFAILIGRLAVAEAPKIGVRATRDQLYIGETFVLEVRISGVPNPPAPDISQIQDCTTRFLGSQSQNTRHIGFVNGRMRSEEFQGRVFVYELTPLKGGDFHAGPVRVTINGQTLVAEGAHVQVTDIERQEWADVEIVASRTQILLDEPFDLTFRLRLKALPLPHDGIDPLFPGQPPQLNAAFLNPEPIGGLKGPDIRQLMNEHLVHNPGDPGWYINEYSVNSNPFDFGSFGLPSPFRESRKAKFFFDHTAVTKDGKKYWQYEIKLSYTPEEEGVYVFGPAEFKGPVVVAANAQGQGESRDVFAIGPACTVRVVPPPEQGRPASYVETLGSNMTAKAFLDTSECKVGDPLQLTLLLSGSVRLDKIVPPKLGIMTNLIRNFEVYDDNVQALKTEGGKQYTYTLRPLREGLQTIPPIEASYFNTSERGYVTIKTEPVNVLVAKSKEVTAAQVVGGRTNDKSTRDQSAAMFTPAPIRTGQEGAYSVSLWPDQRFALFLFLIGPALYAASCICKNFTIRRRERVEAVRAASALTRAVADLRRTMRETPLRSDEAICNAFRGYLADRLNVSAVALTPDDARRMLSLVKADQSVASEFCAAFERVFSAGYSSSPVPDRLSPEEAVTILDALEAGWKKECKK